MLDPNQLFWTRIAAGVCLTIFSLSSWAVLRARSQITASKTWQKIEGEIVSADVEQPQSHFSDDLDDAKPVIRYRYRAGGRDLQGARIGLGGQPLTTRVLAGAMAARYPVGARVDVFVDPRDPESAALEPRNSGNFVAQLALTVAFGVIAAILTAHAVAGQVLYSSNGVPLFAYALPALALFLAAVAFAAYFRGRAQGMASARWPTATGKVVNSSVIEETINKADDDNKGTIRTTTRYYVDFRYSYQVGGRDFVGAARNWAWKPVFGRRDLADKEAAVYASGQMVVVHYDPEQPGSAVLEPGDRQGALTPLVFGAVAAVVGAAILAYLFEVGFGS